MIATTSTDIAGLGLPWITAIVSWIACGVSLAWAAWLGVKNDMLRQAVKDERTIADWYQERASHCMGVVFDLRAQLAIHEARLAKQRAGAAKGRASDKRRAG